MTNFGDGSYRSKEMIITRLIHFLHGTGVHSIPEKHELNTTLNGHPLETSNLRAIPCKQAPFILTSYGVLG
jgi:hypothetical protein